MGGIVMGVAGFSFFLLGIILIIVYFNVKKKNTRCSAQTQGILKEIRKNTSEDISRDEYYYSYNVNGIEYQLKSFDLSPQSNEAGDSCIIWYNPAKPKDALVYRCDSLKFFKLLLIGGIVMVLLGIILPCIGLFIQIQAEL